MVKLFTLFKTQVPEPYPVQLNKPVSARRFPTGAMATQAAEVFFLLKQTLTAKQRQYEQQSSLSARSILTEVRPVTIVVLNISNIGRPLYCQ